MVTGQFAVENIIVAAVSLANLVIGVALVTRPRQSARWLRQFGPEPRPRARARERKNEGWIAVTTGVIAILIAAVGMWVALGSDLTGTARF